MLRRAQRSGGRWRVHDVAKLPQSLSLPAARTAGCPAADLPDVRPGRRGLRGT